MIQRFATAVSLLLIMSVACHADEKVRRKNRGGARKSYGTVLLYDFLLTPQTAGQAKSEVVKIYIDDQFVGNAVLQQPHLQPTFNIASGKHNIRVVVPGFEPFVTDLEVLGNGSTQWIILEPPTEPPTETTGQANEPNTSLAEPKMTKYQNLGGDSNIEEYECGEDYIKIRFRRSSVVYVYDATAPGAEKVAEMKRLAAEGRGLSSYISQQVKSNFSRKE